MAVVNGVFEVSLEEKPPARMAVVNGDVQVLL
jgi:hypothetical protein